VLGVSLGDPTVGVVGGAAGVEVLNFEVGEDPASGDGGTLAQPAASKAMTDRAAT